MKIYKNITLKIKSTLHTITTFYINALNNRDKTYNLILERIVFSPKHNQKIPIIRLLNSNDYIVETAAAILQHEQYKYHLHPDNLLKIYQLADEIKNKHKLNIIQEDLLGEIYLSNGDNVNIYKSNLDNQDLNKLFSLPQIDVARLLESHGFYKGRKIATEIAELKAQKLPAKRLQFKIITQ
jgi:hypothetical protein